MVLLFDFVVFFFKQKTAYEMRISDWSSDVCSSDLPLRHYPSNRCRDRRKPSRRIRSAASHLLHPGVRDATTEQSVLWLSTRLEQHPTWLMPPADLDAPRATRSSTSPPTSCARKTLGTGKSGAVREDLGGGGTIQKKKK